jgi:glycosyltransferase involved in cell wall biosynthesis
MIYPGYSDTFGFGFLEAMSFGIPVVTVDGFARKELVENKRTGFVIEKNFELNEKSIQEINEEIIKKIEEKTSMLIENKMLIKKMSQNCLEEIKNGKFSIKEKNKLMKRVYEGSY